jgi:6-pyruvoyltetrahydropterin/6-carboxytetrahydropterin synthase
MARYRICKSFTVESGHMLSKHSEMCRFPHGHTRTIEIVVSSEVLDGNDMVVDFKLIKHLAKEHIERYDHRMAINSNDPLRESIAATHPDSLIVFEGVDPTTEVIAKEIFDFIEFQLNKGFAADGYSIQPGKVKLERVRVWETPSSWAEYSL